MNNIKELEEEKDRLEMEYSATSRERHQLDIKLDDISDRLTEVYKEIFRARGNDL